MSPEALALLKELIQLRREENNALQRNMSADITKAFKNNFEHEARVLEELEQFVQEGAK